MNAFILKLLSPLLSNTVGSFVRTGLAMLGGMLVSKGITDNDHASSLMNGVSDIVPGLIVYALAQLASLQNKKLIKSP